MSFSFRRIGGSPCVLACGLLLGGPGRPGDGIAGLFSITESGVQFYMRKLVRAVVALVVLALGMVIVPPAQAAYMPTAGATFNDPTGSSRTEQTALMDQIIDAVNNVPSGSVIRFVAYSFDYQPMAHALLAAKKRGAQVRLLIDSHTETDQIRQLRSALGTGTSDGSYLRTCKYSCMANKPSFIHSKLYLFSRTGGAKYVSMNSSANPAETGVSRSWNNTYTTVGDKTLYDANVDNFNDMLPDQHEYRLLPHRGERKPQGVLLPTGGLHKEVRHALQHPERCQLPELHQAHDIFLDECAYLLGREALGSQEGGLQCRGDLSRWSRKSGHYLSRSNC